MCCVPLHSDLNAATLALKSFCHRGGLRHARTHRLEQIIVTFFGALRLELDRLGLCWGAHACAARYMLFEDIVAVKTLPTDVAFVGSKSMKFLQSAI